MSKRSRERMMTGRSVQVRPEPGKLPKPARAAGPEPELRQPMIPSKGYAQAVADDESSLRFVGVVPTSEDRVYLWDDGTDVILGVGGWPTISTARLGHDQRQDFQRLFDDAERRAEATE